MRRRWRQADASGVRERSPKPSAPAVAPIDEELHEERDVEKVLEALPHLRELRGRVGPAVLRAEHRGGVDFFLEDVHLRAGGDHGRQLRFGERARASEQR